jgi:cytochrome c5
MFGVFTYIFVEHHLEVSDRVQMDRIVLLSNGSSIAERIQPVGNVATTETQQAPVEVVAETETATVAPAKVDGAKVYQSACIVCHGAGIAGAPKLGDVAQWEKRIAKGNDVLYSSGINGFQGSGGMMPAKGGNPTLSDAQVIAAVDYMVQQSN